jgi:hypothetical protein
MFYLQRRLTMETRKEDGFWKQVNINVHRFFEELKKDSVASNPHKPVDCCNPPLPPHTKQKLESAKQ